jgi:hypothetical protein
VALDNLLSLCASAHASMHATVDASSAGGMGYSSTPPVCPLAALHTQDGDVGVTVQQLRLQTHKGIQSDA